MALARGAKWHHFERLTTATKQSMTLEHALAV
jgi:hypothetical protein